ncbi:MAG: response regulator [Holophagales bacterium]|nr:response regulator [Holophagales bacterium]
MTNPARTRRHVLVVDDSGPARMLIRQALDSWARSNGERLEVVEAENGFEALRELPRAPFDLVLTDVNMPTLSGLELIRMIRARPEQRGLPVVAISTERDAEDAARARAAGADGYLGKPFDAETFDRLLDELLLPSRAPEAS